MTYYLEGGALCAFPGPVRQDLLALGWNYSVRSAVHVTASPTGHTAWNPYLVLASPPIDDLELQARLAPYRRQIDLSWATSHPDPGVPLADGRELLPFQCAGVARGLRHDRMILGDMPGLGKTIQAIGIIAGRKPKRTLIVCPASLVSMWAAKLKEWLRDPPLIQTITSGKHAVHPLVGIAVVSYGLAGSKALQAIAWDMLICDEAHALKNPKAARTKAVLKGLAARADCFYALTGTPMPNRPREIYEIARTMAHGAIDFMSRDAFMGAYDQDVPTGPMPWQRVKVTGRGEELSMRLRCTLMTRRDKYDVLSDLPPLSIELVEVDNAGTRAAVKSEKLLDLNIDDLNVHVPIDGAVSTVRKDMGVAKIGTAAKFAKDLIEGGDRVLVVAHHTEVIDALAEDLGAEKMDGRTPMTKRQEIVDAFASGAGSALVVQMQVGGLGMDGLQNNCSVAVIVEPDWVPGNNDQAIDRLNRIGQTMPVRAYMLAAPGSIDERIVSACVSKARVTTKALDTLSELGL